MAFKSRGITGLQQYYNQTQLPDVSQEFLRDLTEVVVNSRRKKSVATKNYNPSSFGGCLRKLYYKRKGEPLTPRKMSYSDVRINECGTKSHEVLQAHMSKMPGWQWIDVADYVTTNKLNHLEIITKKDNGETLLRDTRYDIMFCCDGLVCRNGFYYLVEIKTEPDDKTFRRDKPEGKHKEQIACYGLSLGVRGVIFLYEGRSYCSPKCMFIEITPEMTGKITDTIVTVEKYVYEGVVPPACEDKSDCMYCDYINSCRRDK